MLSCSELVCSKSFYIYSCMAHILCIVLFKKHLLPCSCVGICPLVALTFFHKILHMLFYNINLTIKKKSERKLKFLFYICILLKNINHNPHGQTSKMFSNQAHSTPICVTEWHCLDACPNCHSKHRITSHLFQIREPFLDKDTQIHLEV